MVDGAVVMIDCDTDDIGNCKVWNGKIKDRMVL